MGRRRQSTELGESPGGRWRRRAMGRQSTELAEPAGAGRRR